MATADVPSLKPLDGPDQRGRVWLGLGSPVLRPPICSGKRGSESSYSTTARSRPGKPAGPPPISPTPSTSATTKSNASGANPDHYIRLEPTPEGDDILIVGGEYHKTGQANDADARYARLEAWARERFATMGAVEYRWSGQVMESMDGLGFIGRNPGDAEHIDIAAGDSGMGETAEK